LIDDRTDGRTDEALVVAARDGDGAAFGELVVRYRELATRVARVVAPSADLDDTVQEAFVKAWFALPGFRPGAPFRPWICRIVANEAKNRSRASGRRRALALRAVDTTQGVPEDPEGRAIAREDAEALVRAMNGLRDDDRLVIAYRWLFELSEAEMAAALDVAPGTVKSRLSRAMSRLRAALETEATP
jgi:RNA polymerase sigma-70 factor (ECF subfamily)